MASLYQAFDQEMRDCRKCQGILSTKLVDSLNGAELARRFEG
jgi:hypothetical protein